MLMTSLMAWKSREVMARSTSGTTRRVSRPLSPLDRWRSAIVKGAHTCLRSHRQTSTHAGGHAGFRWRARAGHETAVIWQAEMHAKMQCMRGCPHCKGSTAQGWALHLDVDVDVDDRVVSMGMTQRQPKIQARHRTSSSEKHLKQQ